MARKTQPELTEPTPAAETKPAAAPKVEKATAKASRGVAPPSTNVLVANQHMGGITFPRRVAGGLTVKPLRLAPGTVTQLDRAEWDAIKTNRLVQHYLDAGLIAEVNRDGAVPVLSETSSDLQIPENLKSADELMEQGGATAGVRKANAGSVTIS